ncbi:MAG: PPIC-type domain [Actinomycetia bacterium]|nr:PPIC-type domain [Actinomycetes bacterium]
MQRTSLGIIAFVLVAALVGAGCSGSPRADAATVKASSISTSSFNRELTALRDNKLLAQAVKAGGGSISDGKHLVSSSIAASWMNQVIVQKMIDRTFAAAHKKLTAADRAAGKTLAQGSFGGAKTFAAFPAWFRNLEIDRKARTVAVTKTTAAQRAALYQSKFAANAAQCPDILLIIQVPDATTADAVIAQINAGASFSDVAKRESIETTTAAEGGVAGCANDPSIPAELAAAVTGLQPGAPSKPVTVSGSTYVATVEPYGPEVLAAEIATAAQTEALLAIQRPYRGDVHVNPQYGTVKFVAGTGFTVSPPKTPATLDQPGGKVAGAPTTAPTGATATTATTAPPAG